VAPENAGAPRTSTVVLENGESVTVRKMTLGDLGVIVGAVRDAAPELRLDGLDEDAADRFATSLAARLPELLPHLMSCATGRPCEEAVHWSPLDSVRVLRAWLRVNEWNALLREVRDFFGEAMGNLEAECASPAGSSRSSSA